MYIKTIALLSAYLICVCVCEREREYVHILGCVSDSSPIERVFMCVCAREREYMYMCMLQVAALLSVYVLFMCACVCEREFLYTYRLCFI